LPRRVSIFLLLLFSLIGGICEGRASFSHTTYFKNHLVKTLTEPSTQTTTLAYNGKNLVSFKTDPTGAITYGYDDSGLLESVTEGAATISRSYDERGRLKTYTNADGDLIQYRYDANNNLTRLTYPDGKQVNYTYNARNLLATVTDWAGRTTTYQYDRIGRLTGTIRPNGTANIIAHDAASQLTSIKETANGKLISYLKFDYDAASQITRRFRAPLVNSGWQHPAIAATYDDDNRLASINGQSVTHDPDGNMTFGPIRQDFGHLNLTYNTRNQLTNADGISYAYDAEGQRRTITDANGTIRDVIDPSGSLSRLLVRHNANSTKTYYVYGLGLLYEVDEAEKTKTHHFDQVGSTILRTDDTGKVIGSAEYSAYGICFWKQGDMATPFLYNGQAGVQTDPNDLLNMRARYYSPYLMRFLNADPIGFSGGSNWFSYADGDPISKNDPFGLFGWRDVAGFVPVLGSALDAADSFKSGNWGMGLVHTALAVTDLTGAGAIAKGLAVGTMKLGAKKLIKEAYTDTDNWNAMRKQLQKNDIIPTNTRDVSNRDWLTTDHIFVKQRYDLPHSITNHPANLQTGVPKHLNSSFEFMNPLERATHLPAWMKVGAAGVGSYGTGLFLNADQSSRGNK
jgi:RHS repeat-associated protein